MFLNIFPKSLNTLIRQSYPNHRFQTAMLPLVTLEEYLAKAACVEKERHNLHKKELQKAEDFRVEKRRTEWLTGRLAAKLSCLHYLRDDQLAATPVLPAQIIVGNDESGRPYLLGELPQELTNAYLSLSHGGGYATAIVSDSRCGIDIQETRNSLKRVRDKYCTNDEEDILLHQLGELNDLQRLNLLWTTKEAIKKALSHLRMPGFLELMLTGADPHFAGWTLDFVVSSRHFDNYPPRVSAAAELYEGFGIAACLLEGNEHA